MSGRRIAPGTVPPVGHTVTLYQGQLDSRRVIEWFEADGDWVCPATVNGFWYGVQSPQEIEGPYRNPEKT